MADTGLWSVGQLPELICLLGMCISVYWKQCFKLLAGWQQLGTNGSAGGACWGMNIACGTWF